MKAEKWQDKLCQVLEKPLLSYETVIRACDKLSRRIGNGDYGRHIQKMGLDGRVGGKDLLVAARAISKEVLAGRVERELGERASEKRIRFPLGVLLHISAGNVAGLGAYSVVEGLLAGNVNLLKPSSYDNGVSAFLLKELVCLEPELRPYIYIFALPSKRQREIGKLASMADAVVVWGGDGAIRGVRSFVGPDKKLIEWGNKLSFAYVSEAGMEDEEKIRGLAVHIGETQQRLCSSCQEIFLDTEKKEKAEVFARRLVGQMEKIYEGCDMGTAVQAALRNQAFALEDAMHGQVLFRVGGCPIRTLPRRQLVRRLRGMPISLQTAGLICSQEERAELSYLLLRAGAVKVASPGAMTKIFGLKAHDGEYPLLRYTKVVEDTDLTPADEG